MLRMLQRPNITIDSLLPPAQHRPVQLLPHGRAVPEVVLPVDVKARELAGHGLLVGHGLRLVRVEEPLPRGLVVEGRGELGVVAGGREPAE